MGMPLLKLHHRSKQSGTKAVSGEFNSSYTDDHDTYALIADWDGYYSEIYVITANISLLESQNQSNARSFVDVRLCAPVG